MLVTWMHFELRSNAPTSVGGLRKPVKGIGSRLCTATLCMSTKQFHNCFSRHVWQPRQHSNSIARPFVRIHAYIHTYERMYVCMYTFIYRMSMRVCICVPEWPACPACLAPAYFVSWQHKQVAARCSVVFSPSNLRYCYNSAALCSFVRLLSIWFRFCVINNLLLCVCVRAYFENYSNENARRQELQI